MATYAIGDVQGCFEPLQNLLETIRYDEKKDSLWFAGDLVNRGPHSLETLRFIKKLGKNTKIVLGNHDLHFLARAHHAHSGGKGDTLDALFAAPDLQELVNWLLQQPLLQHDPKLDVVMVHAGLAPSWDLVTAKKLAEEVSRVLQGPAPSEFFKHMYGSEPRQWHENLAGWDRLRCITNYFTRLRFCHLDGSLELNTKGKISTAPTALTPWFKLPHRVNADLNIIFGHWAALGGVTDTAHTFALDTGCVWGQSLTAMRLEDQIRFNVSCTR